jgi:hypothetical protein
MYIALLLLRSDVNIDRFRPVAGAWVARGSRDVGF